MGRCWYRKRARTTHNEVIEKRSSSFSLLSNDRDYLTYDEGKLAALLGASTKTVTINRGERLNSGIPSEKDDFEKFGVIIGLVGPRMNKNTVMESQELRVTEEQNTKENGYGKRQAPQTNV